MGGVRRSRSGRPAREKGDLLEASRHRILEFLGFVKQKPPPNFRAYICCNALGASACAWSLPVRFVSERTIDNGLDILTNPARPHGGARGNELGKS